LVWSFLTLRQHWLHLPSHSPLYFIYLLILLVLLMHYCHFKNCIYAFLIWVLLKAMALLIYILFIMKYFLSIHKSITNNIMNISWNAFRLCYISFGFFKKINRILQINWRPLSTFSYSIYSLARRGTHHLNRLSFPCPHMFSYLLHTYNP
jgi:hypothetical protein